MANDDALFNWRMVYPQDFGIDDSDSSGYDSNDTEEKESDSSDHENSEESENSEDSEDSANFENFEDSEDTSDSEREVDNFYNYGIYILVPLNEGRALAIIKTSWSNFVMNITREVVSECQRDNGQICVVRSLLVKQDLHKLWLGLIFDIKTTVPGFIKDIGEVDESNIPLRVRDCRISVMTRLHTDFPNFCMISLCFTCRQRQLPPPRENLIN